MASAVLTSRNGPRSSDFMNRFTTNNGDVSFMRLNTFQNPNPNPNPSPNSNHFFVGNTNSRGFHRRNHQQLPYSAPPQPAFVGSSGYRYITFRLGSYSRRELKQLKKRLMSDLERVRVLRQWVCSTLTPKTSHHQPPVVPKETQKTAVGQKRTNRSPPVRETKKQCGRMTTAAKRKMIMRECGQILGKLMTHKHGWVFNTPVDAAALKLYDYHNVISNPMDLGTIKCKLAKNEYESPLAFASDIRLTFNNAMVYNGKGSDVFIMAERLLLLFEDLFNSRYQKLLVNQVKKQNRSVSVPIAVEKQVLNAPIVVETPVVHQSNAAKLGASVVRVSNKPEMTAEEKSELAASFLNLQLGPEGMDQIMAIVKKGVSGLEHQGDEIELDLAVLDNDTLWGLHSFICSTRKELVTNSVSLIQTHDPMGNQHVVEEEDIDIGEEMQSTIFPPVEIEKDAVNVSSSESSSDSDSSSSDSGSGTCSGNSYNEQEVNSTPKVVQ